MYMDRLAKPLQRAVAMLSASNKSILILFLCGATVGSAFVSLNIGTIDLSPSQVLSACLGKLGVSLGLPELAPESAQVILALRLPRILLALLVGMSLAICGTALQGLFRNPLADPGLIGVTSGGAVGAALMIVLGSGTLHLLGPSLQSFATISSAMLGSIGSTCLIYRLAKIGGRIHVPTMLLCGIAVNALAGAILGTLIYIAELDKLRDLTFWSLGSFARAPRTAIFVAIPLLILLLIQLLRQAKQLNVLLLGDAEAGHLGLDTHPLRRQLILLTGAIVGICVALSGTIAFVGLIMPHLMRLLVGPNHSYLLPAAGLAGGVLLILADILARTMLSTAEIPIGILTAFLGAPFFLFLLLSARRKELV